MAVSKVTAMDTAVTVYNFTVDTDHNYFVGQARVLVHNTCGEEIAKRVTSIVKKDSKLSKIAKETFEGNDLLRKEANGLIEQLTKGNMNPGIGSKSIGKGIYEARSRGAARVYLRNAGIGVEIVVYSNKVNQQTVIDRILDIY